MNHAEMAAVQEAHQMREVQGIIFFGYNNLDPQTAPWNRVVRAYVLVEVLETLRRERPSHPLVAVFQPLIAESEDVLQREAAHYYQAIKGSGLPEASTRALVEVFVSWLEQRFKQKGKKEIEAMLLGELPDLEETQSGKDLIRIGEQRAILVFLRARHGAVPAAIEEEVRKLGPDEAERLVEYLSQDPTPTLEALTQWLSGHQMV